MPYAGRDKTIAVDADGTLLEYITPWALGKFGDPLDGAKETLQWLKEDGYTIIIFTTRGDDLVALDSHLMRHEIPFDYINVNPDGAPPNVSKQKVDAGVFIDDRAITFDGSWKGMYERIINFKPWHKRPNRRPSLNLAIAGYHVDQISLYVPRMSRSLNHYRRLGHNEWVNDVVKAYDITNDSHFKVNLAFNYTMFPVEFELIQVIEGDTVQIPIGEPSVGLSHYGFHVGDIGRAAGRFEELGYGAMATISTIEHSQCPYLYRYTFMDTRELGFISKLIERVT